ncbi:hypothetical protein HAX54_018878 [Datura stramonium]|uniref:3'-5' exonuclease domain-containing protein n=1 Tax=Datura stramonium TaxID=4076 RepID=A0ABS8RJE0_DATST|nr:hypothetical protein [Datura stramonium]
MAELFITIIFFLHIHQRRLHKLLIGLDIEWRAPNNPTEEIPSAALLQLCVGRRCLLFQLLHTDYIPNSLHAFLGNPTSRLWKASSQDAEKLCKDHGLFVANPMDLNRLALVVQKLRSMGESG